MSVQTPPSAVPVTGGAAVTGATGATGATVWLTGLPSAGKTTVATAVAEQLVARGRRVQVLDGDEVRETLSRDLGFSRQDRATQVARVGWVARLLAGHGVVVLAPLVSPYAADRDLLREAHHRAGVAFLEVHVSTPVEVCADRDVKGLYAAQAAGQLTGLTGVDGVYEPPVAPELVLASDRESLDASASRVLDLLAQRGLA